MKFLILNGPNINLARWSEPGVPGEVDYTGLMDYVQAGCDQLGIETDICQSNHEGDLIDEIQSAPGRVDGIVLNPGGYAHYSVAILDALRLCSVPAVEVMLDAPDEREPFRKTDVVSNHEGDLTILWLSRGYILSGRRRPGRARALPQNGRGVLWLSGTFYRRRPAGLPARLHLAGAAAAHRRLQ